MPERRPVVSGIVIKYSGLFNAKELWKLIENWFDENGYSDRPEVYHDEYVVKGHKDIEIRYQPYRKVSDYMKLEHRLIIKILDLEKKTITKDGHKIKVDKADLNIRFDSFLNTDYEGRWENTPGFFFIRTLFDKFVFKTYTGKYEQMLGDQVQEMKTLIEKYLNIYRSNS
ncbi:MAG: hypothetical protein ACLFUO_06985 [Candidatus Woesearchaeota archaeon]